MKNVMSKFSIFAFISALFLVSCGDEYGDIIIQQEGTVEPTPVDNTLAGEITEDLRLDPSIQYSLTDALHVMAGATLTIPAGTTIISDKGTDKFIVVEKGGDIEIQGTASNPVLLTSAAEEPGDWGGLVICGDATTTAGVDATAEVASLIYGGNNDEDNSGTINYLIINYAGASINPDSQYNGLTLYAVGSGTTISNVAMLNGTDDGVEFFGGTVSTSNMYMENNEDDSIDWTEGWSGTVTNAYILHTIEGFSTVIEGDKLNNNPKFVNMTAVSTTGGTALQFKAQSGATITGLSLTGYETSIDMPNDGPLENVIIDGEPADPTRSYTTQPTVDIAMFDWVSSNQNPNGITYLSGTVTEDITLNPSETYFVDGTYSIEAGAKLTIPAGTKIVSEKGTDKFIVIQKGAQIDVQGTESNPVIMTSSGEKPGDWGGLVICGDATTTAGVDATAEVGGLLYGGNNDADNSGSISYLIINYAGASINSESQYNGLTLYAVGSGTTIDNVAMLNGTDDGVEFFGGTVSVSNFYMENNEDDSVDWTEGWSGTVTNGYVLHTIEGFSTVMEGDNVNNNPKFVNFTAVSTTGGTALQFKKESGATITGLSLTGYDKSIDMPNDGPLENVIIEGKVGDTLMNYTTPASVDVATFAWVNRAEVEPEILQGTVTGTVTLDAGVPYTLNSSYIVQAGGKLVIPAGTKITARDGGTGVYIAVLKGGQIEINGTPENPVVISSLEEKPGDWGGLTLCGNATTTAGVDAVAEVGGFIYGGNNDADNSGIIKNLVILGTGAEINSESQYNGVSFYSVGSGTTVENIAVINGADDGVEFFGGTVSATNLYMENNEDDAIDWTEGWSGTLTDSYILHTIDGFSTALEGDNVNNNPKFVNLTAISSTGGTALQFKKQSGGTITNLHLEGYTKLIDMKDGGPLANVIIEGAAATLAGPYSAEKVDISGWNWINARL